MSSTMSRTIVCLHHLTTEQEAQIREAAPEFRLILGKAKKIDPAIIQEAEILIGWSRGLEAAALHEDSKLRWIQSWSAGIDKMPLEQLANRNIVLTDASGVHAVPITEMIFGLLLAHTRYIHPSTQHQQQRQWSPPASELGEIHGKTMLIVGVGEIGSETARIASAFGMRVLGVRRSGKSVPHVDHMYTMDGLYDALAQADVIVNILPYTEETHHLFDERAFQVAKRGSSFINVGRGSTVKTDALIQALEQGTLAYAGLDVFEEEPLPAEHPLWSMDNVLITPHIAGSTDRYSERVLPIFLENLQDYIKGQQPGRNRVDYSKKY